MRNDKKISITIDDLPFVSLGASLNDIELDTQIFIEKLKRDDIKTTVFVVGQQVCIDNESKRRLSILESWHNNGHILGNHTYSHLSFANTSIETYIEDIVHNEKILNLFWGKTKSKICYFRFPYLEMGKDVEKKRKIIYFLRTQSYIIAPVSIDSSDYIFNKVYIDALSKGNLAFQRYVVEAYLKYLDEIVRFIEKLTLRRKGASTAHILLLHANRINAHHIDRVVSILKIHGYSLVSLQEALSDIILKQKITQEVKEDSSDVLVVPSIDSVVIKAYKSC